MNWMDGWMDGWMDDGKSGTVMARQADHRCTLLKIMVLSDVLEFLACKRNPFPQQGFLKRSLQTVSFI